MIAFSLNWRSAPDLTGAAPDLTDDDDAAASNETVSSPYLSKEMIDKLKVIASNPRLRQWAEKAGTQLLHQLNGKFWNFYEFMTES